MEENEKKLDKLTDNRKMFLENLYKLIKNELQSEDKERINTIAIDSSWGMGKTYFAEVLEEYIKDNEKEFEIKVLKFNAWENDYYDDPMKTLIGEMNEQKLLNSEVKEKAEKIIKNSIKSGLKVLSTLLLRKFNLTNDDLNAIKELFGGINESELNDYKSYKEMVSNFKIALENKNIIGEKFEYKLIIVDELDRCRPNFAVEVLETIKHIFNVNGLIFVFMINKNLLNKSVETLYGEINDNEEYFKKFFDIEFSLPKLEFDNYLEKEYPNMIDENNLVGNGDEKEAIYDLKKFGEYVFLRTLEVLNISQEFSPREQKIMFRKYKILYLTFSEEEKSNLDFLICISAFILYTEKNKEKVKFIGWFIKIDIENKEMKDMERMSVSPTNIKEHLKGLKNIMMWINKGNTTTDYLENGGKTYCLDYEKRKTNINISNTMIPAIESNVTKYYNIYFPNIGDIRGLQKDNLRDILENYFENKYSFLENIK